jgi:hypothetical protein
MAAHVAVLPRIIIDLLIVTLIHGFDAVQKLFVVCRVCCVHCAVFWLEVR